MKSCSDGSLADLKAGRDTFSSPGSTADCYHPKWIGYVTHDEVLAGTPAS